jgi:outer membrane protein
VEQEIKSSNVGVQGSLPLINGLTLHNQARQSFHNYKASEYDLAKSINDVSLNIAYLFINVVFNQEQLQNSTYLLESNKQQLERTRKQVEAGSLPRSEQLNFEAQLATNELTVVQNENALALSILQLKQALQIPANQPFSIEVPELDVEDFILESTREDIYTVAEQLMPEIKSSQLRVESSYYGVKAARGSLLPRLSLVSSLQTNYSSTSEPVFMPDGSITYSTVPIAVVNNDPTQQVFAISRGGRYENINTFSDQFRNNIYRTLGLQLVIPILNGNQARASYQRSKIVRERALINQKEVANTLRTNVETAYNDALAASKTYASAERQVSMRDEAYRMMKQRYEIGASYYVEYIVSENELYRAKSDLVRAKYDFIFKKKVLDFYQGKQLDY